MPEPALGAKSYSRITYMKRAAEDLPAIRCKCRGSGWRNVVLRSWIGKAVTKPDVNLLPGTGYGITQRLDFLAMRKSDKERMS